VQSSKKDTTHASETARSLANEVVESYVALRKYLQEVGTCLECVDPHLCKNTGLVARLVDFEESWELGSLYVQQKNTLDALCECVSQVKRAQNLSPIFATQCENCEVEMFLVLPRIMWLTYLANPDEHSELMGSLLPKRFNRRADVELASFKEKFRQLVESLSNGMLEKKPLTEMLLMQAVAGPSSQDTTLESFMLELERWSMELQRSNPKDWNQCSSTIVQCMIGGPQKERHGEFNV